MKRRDVFQALADPTRRAILGLIANETLNLNSVAEKFDVSRPAISKHIKILTQCGLIKIRQKGRERFCEATLESLSQVDDWLVDYRKFWNSAASIATPSPPIEAPVRETLAVEAPSPIAEPKPKQKKPRDNKKPAPELPTSQGSLFGF